MNDIKIADVSFYQYGYKDPANGDWTITRYVDFKKMRTQTPAVIIRAGQNLWKDRTFDISWSAAWLAELARGSYWFYDSRADPKKQAQLWIETLGGDLGELPLFPDFEENYGGAWAGWKHWYTFLEELKRLAPGKEIIIYSAYYFWLENTAHKNIPAASLEYFKQYQLWIANYGVTTPLIPLPWTEWTFWQYTSSGDGLAYGVESKEIDLNYFNGDLAAFNARFGLSGNVPEPTPIPIPPSITWSVTRASGRQVKLASI